MKVLVTGGSGFIGWHVCRELSRRGDQAVPLDRVAGEGTSILADVRDADAVHQAVFAADGVIHLAGVLGTQETVANPRPAFSTNIDGSINVFEACTALRKPAVYIAVGNHWMNNPYSISKTAIERLAFMYNKERGARIAVVRGMNAYGPRQKAGPVRKIIPTFILAALAGKPLLVYGDGEQRMDMVYVADLAGILVDALVLNHGCYDSAFEAGTGIAPTVNQIAAAVIAATGSKSQIEHSPMRPGEEDHSTVVADFTTLAPLFRYTFSSLAVGLPPTVEWYKGLPH